MEYQICAVYMMDEYCNREIASLFLPSVKYILESYSSYSLKAIEFLNEYVSQNEF